MKNTSTNTLGRTKRLTVTSVLAAIVIVVSFLPLKTLGFEINFAMVPVAIGGILYGPLTGAVLGAVFGLVSFFQCFGYSALGVALLAENAFFTLLVCLPTRVLAGLIPAVIARILSKTGNVGKEFSYPLCSLLAPLLNTVFFMGTLVLLFYRSETIQYYVDLLKAANPFIFILMFVGINGLVEIIAGFVVAYPVSKVLKKFF